jgi:hypothetical protein
MQICRVRPARAFALRLLFLAAMALLLAPARADAYIGPGAGFAVLSSFLVVFTTILIAIASILIWPFRALWRLVTGQKPFAAESVPRIMAKVAHQHPPPPSSSSPP